MTIDGDKVAWVTSNPTGWIDMQLDQESIDFLWNSIAESKKQEVDAKGCLLYTSPSPRDISGSRMPSSA